MEKRSERFWLLLGRIAVLITLFTFLIALINLILKLFSLNSMTLGGLMNLLAINWWTILAALSVSYLLIMNFVLENKVRKSLQNVKNLTKELESKIKSIADLGLKIKELNTEAEREKTERLKAESIAKEAEEALQVANNDESERKSKEEHEKMIDYICNKIEEELDSQGFNYGLHEDSLRERIREKYKDLAKKDLTEEDEAIIIKIMQPRRDLFGNYGRIQHPETNPRFKNRWES